MNRLTSINMPICAEPGGTDEGISLNKKECTSCEQKNDDVDASCKLLNGMNICDVSADSIPVCANCGKEGNIINICNKCKMVKYCNAACKKKHRHKHKKDCEEHQSLAAEQAAKLHDEKLFKQAPLEYEDCLICFLRMPILDTGKRYKLCCGKTICSGCIHAVRMRDGDVGLCPFCRIPAPESDEKAIEYTMKRVEVGDKHMATGRRSWSRRSISQYWLCIRER